MVEFIPSGQGSNPWPRKLTERMEIESRDDEAKDPYYSNQAEDLIDAQCGGT